MAATRVQSKTGTTSPGATLNITFDSNVTAGNLITAQVSVYNAINTAICTVTGGGTWTTHETDQNGANSVHIASAGNATGGATTVTITITGSTGDRYITAVIEEWSGVLTTGVFDVSSSSNGTGTAASTGTTASKAQNNELVLAVIGCGGDNAVVPSGFSTSYLLNNSASFQPIGAGYKSVNASGTESASGTLLGSDNWAAAIATFKEAGGGDTTAPTLTSPTGTATGSTTASGTVSTDEANGTAYAVVTVSATAPTAAQVRAGQDNSGATAAWSGNQAVTTTGTKNFSATGLTASTSYYFHFHHRDAANNDSTVVSSAQFTTTAGASIIKQMLMQHGD